jgi:uncharacterized Fe-S cluster-containing radical SAM superfamily protein
MDLLRHAEHISSIVSRGRLRKYYRFRWAGFYGGIATADCVGCCLRCVFCWSWDVVNNPEGTGKFYSPEYVADRLIKIARKKRCTQMRVSGNEATLNREHLLALLGEIPSHYRFILETNGIVLGSDTSYCRDLARFPNLFVRVSLKGCCGEDFQRLTGMDEEGFDLQIKALENLVEEGVHCHPAVMNCFSSKQAQQRLSNRLGSIEVYFNNMEEEELILYPAVKHRLEAACLI